MVGSVRSPRRPAMREMCGLMPRRLYLLQNRYHIRHCSNYQGHCMSKTSSTRLLSARGGTIEERRAGLMGGKRRSATSRMIKRYSRYEGRVSEEERRVSDGGESYNCSVSEEGGLGSKLAEREQADITKDDLEYTRMETHVRVFGIESSYSHAVEKLILEVEKMKTEEWDRKGSRCVRLEVPLCRGDKSLLWLKGQLQGENCVSRESMSVYFSSRSSSAPDTEGSMAAELAFCGEQSVAGVGTAWLWKGKQGSRLDNALMKEIRRMTADDSNKVRAFGGARFDPGSKSDPEWEPFGSFCFFIPRIEYKESINGNVLACTIAWDTAWKGADHLLGVTTIGFSEKYEAVEDAIAQLRALRPASLAHAASVCLQSPCTAYHHTPNEGEWHDLLDTVQNKFRDTIDEAEDIGADVMSVSPMVALDEYLRNGQKGLDELLAASKPGDAIGRDSNSLIDGDQLMKLVLARKTDLLLEENVDCCDLLGAVQEKDPKAYQFMLRLPTGQCFLGCTPERLYARTKNNVVSEAVAGTRGRGAGGDVEEDFWLAFDLLQSQKDGLEFQLVRDSILSIFDNLCSSINLEVEKSVLKQGMVQHLYSRIAGILRPDVSDLDLITELHPTPAVCGQPDDGALCVLREFEMFDRGFYAGPFGWFGGNSADIAVAIRSSLVGPPAQKKTPITLFAGVGIVPGSSTQSEWNELDLKIRQFTSLFQTASNGLIKASSNCNVLVAQSMVDELCRLGHNTFCIAPGSRSSPLTLAAARHPKARLIPGIDERSLGYWALGHAKARNKPCVIITSSGTAVANLLPAVVEASQSNIPLIILSADRPSELRDTGSNQTIDQVGIFGKYVRWETDLQAPGEDALVRHFLTAVDNAVRYATSPCDPGPVHLNCQFRDPLNPKKIPWGDRLLDGLDQWLKSSVPFSAALGSGFLEARLDSFSPGLDEIILNPKGVLILGEMGNPRDIAAAIRLGTLLGWPVFADILAGVRIGGASVPSGSFKLINHFDQMLLSRDHWKFMKPCSILHLGGRLTSKRLSEFLAWSVLDEHAGAPATYMVVRQARSRYDPLHTVKYRLECSVECLVEAAKKIISETGTPVDSLHRDAYANQFVELDSVVLNVVSQMTSKNDCMTEVHVAKVVGECLPLGHGLFIGNSMPIRDLDMFSGPRKALESENTLGAPVAANRGASGIDGVLSTAAGFADGLGRKCTLVVGDVSFLHDVNGLNLLRTGTLSPPLTVVLVNNNGGGIFNFLPISGDVPDEQFRPLWTTPQHVDIAGLCRAQGIPHSKVNTLDDLERSLRASWQLNRHCILEVVTNIPSNVKHHDIIKEQIASAIDGYYDKHGRILEVHFERFSIPLSSHLTTQDGHSKEREGVYIYLSALFSDGSIHNGVGEISPLDGLHAESVKQALDQCKTIRSNLVGSEFGEAYNPMELNLRVPGLSDIAEAGVRIHPSVRSGLDAALWNAIASHKQINTGQKEPMKVSALINPFNKSYLEINNDIKNIIDEGYCCIKIKVGRFESPFEDAEVVKAIRGQVGPFMTLRVDANQAWSLQEAMDFCNSVSSCNIEYLEEPLNQPCLLYDFKPSIPIALDESIDQGVFSLEEGSKLPNCVKHVVLKPSLLGGLSETIRLSNAAEQLGVTPVISSCFESQLGLLHLSQIASLVDPSASRYHGISTESWFQDKTARVSCNSEIGGRFVPSNVWLTYAKALSLQSKNDSRMIPQCRYTVSTSRVTWSIQQLCCNFFPQGAVMRKLKQPLILLHGMFGSSSEMSDLAKKMAENTSRPIILVDLPGHGGTSWKSEDQLMKEAHTHPTFQLMEVMSEQLAELLNVLGNGCTLVGYSLGARLALLTSIRYPDNIQNVVSISGGLGIRDSDARICRQEEDKIMAEKLRAGDTLEFLREWYRTDLWKSLREKEWFESYLNHKALQLRNSREILSFTLLECSPGKAPCIQDLLLQEERFMEFFLVAGRLDSKYASMLSSLKDSCENDKVCFIEIQDAGHAIHLEKPQTLTDILAKLHIIN